VHFCDFHLLRFHVETTWPLSLILRVLLNLFVATTSQLLSVFVSGFSSVIWHAARAWWLNVLQRPYTVAWLLDKHSRQSGSLGADKHPLIHFAYSVRLVWLLAGQFGIECFAALTATLQCLYTSSAMSKVPLGF